MRRITAVLLFLATTPLAAQDAMALLKNVQAAGASLTSFEMESSSVQERAFSNRTDVMNIQRHAYGASPGKVRLEFDFGNGKTLVVFDGEQTWTYNSGTHTYTRVAGFKGNWLGDFTVPFERVSTARITGQDRVQIDGTNTTVTVIQAEREYRYAGPEDCHRSTMTYSIDEARMLPVKTVETWVCGPQSTTITNVIRHLTTNLALAESVFRFTPPEGSTQVSEPAFGGNSR